MSSFNQKARIFRTWVEEDTGKKTSVGETYTSLRAKAYMLITDETKDMIEQIEGEELQALVKAYRTGAIKES